MIKLGNKLSGHKQILHGGITALLFDNAFGWCVYLLPEKPLGFRYVTAHLGIDYKSPGTLNDNRYLMVCEIDRVEKGRKLYLKGTLVDVGTGRLIAESDALFIAQQSEDKELYKQLHATLECFEKQIHPEDPQLKCTLDP
jgi:acyl-coenzyme A thioesterase PaaI-like protein